MLGTLACDMCWLHSFHTRASRLFKSCGLIPEFQQEGFYCVERQVTVLDYPPADNDLYNVTCLTIQVRNKPQAPPIHIFAHYAIDIFFLHPMPYPTTRQTRPFLSISTHRGPAPESPLGMTCPTILVRNPKPNTLLTTKLTPF